MTQEEREAFTRTSQIMLAPGGKPSGQQILRNR